MIDLNATYVELNQKVKVYNRIYVSLIGASHYEFVLDVLQHLKNEIKIAHSLITKLTEEE